MKTAKLLVAVLVSVFLILAPQTVQALKAVQTPTEHWLTDTPLIVSAYQRSFDGNNLVLLEIFNVSDAPVDATQWQLAGQYEAVATGTTKDETVVSDIALRGGIVGKLAPGAHAVIELKNGTPVTNSSYVSPGFERPTWLADTKAVPIQKGQLVGLSLVPTDQTIETDTYTTKTTSTKIANVTTTVYDDLWRRVPQSEPGYLSTLYATTVAEGGLYDDGLYSPPKAPLSRIVEVYHHGETCLAGDPRTECGDYIKLQIDPNDELDKFVVRTDNSSTSRTTTNTFLLAGRTVSPEGYITIMYNDADGRLDLTDAGGTIWLEERYGQAPYAETKVQYAAFSEDNKTWAYIFDATGVGQWTTTPQPNLPNTLTQPVVEVAVCSAGKYLNPDTGRCRTVEEAVNALATCPEGQERNPATNRCRAKVIAVSTTLTPCGEGQERNPATNRCRSIASAVAELLPCDEGYERNPATNRCRKAVMAAATTAGSPASLVEQAKGSDWNAWTWALVAVGATGAIGYGVYEWRSELLGLTRKIAAKLGKK